MYMPDDLQDLSFEEQFQILMDEREIRNLIYRWCRSIDRIDPELLATCFHDDAIDHHRPFFDGLVKDNIIDGFPDRMRKQCASSQYLIGNILIEIDGNVARVESYCWTQKNLDQVADDGSPMIRLSGHRYVDRMEKHDRRWKIAERWFVPDFGWFQNIRVETKTIGNFVAPSEMTLQPTPGLRNRSDPSYWPTSV